MMTVCPSFLSGILLLSALTCAAAQDTIIVGAIAVIGMNKENPDGFALLALETISAGNRVKVTDNGWTSSTGFNNIEGTLQFDVTADISAGMVWTFEEGDNSTYTTDYGSWTVEENFKLARGGDQILVYTGADTAPYFIYGASNGWTESPSDSSSSQLPDQLISPKAFVTLPNDVNSKYMSSSPHAGTMDELLKDINDATNWQGSNDTRFNLHSFVQFNVTYEDDSIDMVSESGIIAIVLVCLLVIFGALLNEIVACKKEKSRKELLHKGDDEDESKL
mmetsp:Transcript_370/g.686  ORF Transcript_370/g.686 Transcript_370/m.686 type:complete len:278 (+) Transcript_370:44-877(+)